MGSLFGFNWIRPFRFDGCDDWPGPSGWSCLLTRAKDSLVVGIASTGQIDALEIGRISLLSVLFLGSVLLFGGKLVGRLVPFVTTLGKHHVKLLTSVTPWVPWALYLAAYLAVTISSDA